ncbi:Serine/threonine-protein kinase [Ceratobasidium sp. AG-Ba]|nr:Serine/threonine-protein kinase [Ceratobasidium sp. AG-Ba]
MRLHVGPSDSGRKTLKHAARELHIWSKCQHPNVLALMGLVIFRDQIGMVSRWMEQGNLPTYIAQNPGVDRFQLSADISAGLAYLHQTGIVHGDLKGVNVLVGDNGIPMLADFGNAVLYDYTLNFTTTTRKYSLSPRWAAPELLDEREATYSQQADVYALGMTVLEAFTGQVPYADKSDYRVMIVVTVEKEYPTRPEEHIPLNSRHGDALWQLLKRCWAHNPAERPQACQVAEIVQGFRRLNAEEKQTLKNLGQGLKARVEAAEAMRKAALDWAHILVKLEVQLVEWSQSLSRVVDKNEDREAIRAFRSECKGLEILSQELAITFKRNIASQISCLVESTAGPLRCLARIVTDIQPSNGLTGKKWFSQRLTTELESDLETISLASQLRDELPRFVEIFDRALEVIIVKMLRCQADFYQSMSRSWRELLMSLDMAGGEANSRDTSTVEIQQVWQERWQCIGFAVDRRVIELTRERPMIPRRNKAHPRPSSVPATKKRDIRPGGQAVQPKVVLSDKSVSDQVQPSVSKHSRAGTHGQSSSLTLVPHFPHEKSMTGGKPSKGALRWHTGVALQSFTAPSDIVYQGLPFLDFETGDVFQIIADKGQISDHPGLPVSSSFSHDRLLSAQNLNKVTGWVIASCLMPTENVESKIYPWRF